MLDKVGEIINIDAYMYNDFATYENITVPTIP